MSDIKLPASETKLKIVIVDDEESRSETWARGIRTIVGDQAEVIALNLENVRKEVAAIFFRRRKFGEGDSTALVKDCGIASTFDDAHVLILDYDLRNMDGAGSEWTTGSEVAMAARAYSTAGTIVLVNRTGNNKFDLTMIKIRGSKADVEIGAKQVTNPGLWLALEHDGYRPWTWPSLLEDHIRYEDAANWVEAHMDQPIFKSLELQMGGGAGEIRIRKEHWLELGIDPDTDSYVDLVAKNQYLPPRDRDAIARDKKQSARVAAAILRSWFDKILVPSQDLLIDAPHLAYLMPWLLGDVNDGQCWNNTANLCNPYSAFKSDLRKYKYKFECFLTRPAFFRSMLATGDDTQEPSGFNYNEIPDLVFCEDVSQFLDFSSARPFACSLDSEETQRYVCDPDVFITGKFKTSEVEYEPSALFAL